MGNDNEEQEFTAQSGKDKNGKFVPGNTYKRAPTPEQKCIKTATRDEVLRCAHKLAIPIKKFKEEIENNPDISSIAYLTYNAVKKNDVKFIAWLLEMSIGKAKQVIDHDTKSDSQITITYEVASNIEEAVIDES